MNNKKTTLTHHFKLGDYVHFAKSYTQDSKDKTLAVGKITTLLNEHCGVTPTGSNKELFFYYHELKRIESKKMQHKPLSTFTE
jgi:hypothetical protein